MIANPSRESIDSVEGNFGYSVCNNVDISAAFSELSKQHTAKYNLLIDGRFAVYNKENILRSIEILDDPICKYGVYGTIDENGYWTPQMALNIQTHQKYIINCPFVIKHDLLARLQFDGIKNIDVYNKLLRQIASFVGVDFCFPGIKLCHKS